MRVHAGDMIKVDDIGTLGTVKKTDGKGNGWQSSSFRRERLRRLYRL